MKYRFLRFPEGKFKAVTLTYDDGTVHDKRMAEVLGRYGMKCTFNIGNVNLGTAGHMTAKDVQTYILDAGHEVAVHGAHHRALGMIRPAEGIREVLDCRIALENTFDCMIRGMAYPDTTQFGVGCEYETARAYLRALDIDYCRTAGGDNFDFELPADWYQWMPSVKSQNPDVMEYVRRFVALKEDELYIAMRQPRLFSMWGHSYEFENDQNWDVLERVCAEIGGRDDTWYATNGEIYDYVQAWESLKYSADHRRVYNPTATDVWMSVDGTVYCVRSGETLVL